MKNTILILAIIMVAGVTLNSCKKGDNDPFLSLASRDARITEVWKLTDYEKTTTNLTTFGEVSYENTTTYTYDGSIITKVKINPQGNATTETYSFSYNVDIQKNGTYTSTTIDKGESNKITSNWWWTNSQNNKTGIILENDGNYIIDRLAKTELILTSEYVNVEINTDNETDSTYVFEKLTFTKQ